MKSGEEKQRGWEISVETRAVIEAGGENRTKIKQNSGGWAGNGRRKACCTGVLHSLTHSPHSLARCSSLPGAGWSRGWGVMAGGEGVSPRVIKTF